MKVAGIVRIDRNGRIVFPTELRRVLNMKNGDPVEIFADTEFIHIRRYYPTCIFCGDDKDIKEYKGRNICTKCQTGIFSAKPSHKRSLAL